MISASASLSGSYDYFEITRSLLVANRVQLRQVVLNLILNGIEAMNAINDRPRDLLIRSSHHQEDVLIEVHDSGHGVDIEQAERIFDSLFTTKPQGIGVGLSLSRSIVEAHGGRLWVAAPGFPYSLHSQNRRKQRSCPGCPLWNGPVTKNVIPGETC
jgi:signal transduction histidine kinase